MQTTDFQIFNHQKPKAMVTNSTTSVNIRANLTALTQQDCTESCCSWNSCHIAVIEGKVCLNVTNFHLQTYYEIIY